MASPNPVPSRALLHALRGILFTTSCSVALLAEERRRRIKFAQNALEKARKIHSAKAARNSVAARAEPAGDLDYLYDETHSIIDRPQRTRSSRRRRQKPQHHESLERDWEYEAPRPALARDREPSNVQRHLVPRLTAYARQLLDITSTNIVAPPISYHDHLIYLSKLEAVDSAIRAANISQRLAQLRKHNSSDYTTIETDLSYIHLLDESWDDTSLPHANESDISYTNLARDSHTVASHPALDKDVLIPNPVYTLLTAGPHTWNQDREYLRVLSKARIFIGQEYRRRTCAEMLPILESLLQLLDSAHLRQPLAADLLHASNALLLKVHTKEGQTPAEDVDSFKQKALRLLQNSVKQNSSYTITIMTSLCRLLENSHLVIAPLLHWLARNSYLGETRDILEWLSQHDQNHIWKAGKLMYYTLARYRAEKDYHFPEAQKFYAHVRDAGLFEHHLDAREKWRLHRIMYIWALEAGEEQFAGVELQALSQLDNPRSASDFLIDRAIIIRDASLGEWATVFSRMEELYAHDGDTPMSSERKDIYAHDRDAAIDFQELFDTVVDKFAANHTGDELESCIRRLVALERINLKYRWADAVLSWHVARRQFKHVLHWIQFCRNVGLESEKDFIQRLWISCRQQWDLSEEQVFQLGETAGPEVLNDFAATFATPVSKEAILGTQRNGKRWTTLPSDIDDEATSTSSGACDDPLLDTMKSLATDERWRDICVLYEETTSAGTVVSGSCLAAAVEAYIQKDHGDLEHAAEVVLQAKGRGLDVTMALTPLLVTQMRQGLNPRRAVTQALDRGFRLEDRVYNYAAMSLAKQGHMSMSGRLCKLAASQNGGKDLLYHKWNFSNLIFAYAGARHYRRLEALLELFNSRTEPWQGERFARKSILLAMKAVAKRAVADEAFQEDHLKALGHLEESLRHLNNCRLRKYEEEDHQHTELGLAMEAY